MKFKEFNDKHEEHDCIKVYFYQPANILDIACHEGVNDCVVQLDKETLGNFIDHLNEVYEELK